MPPRARRCGAGGGLLLRCLAFGAALTCGYAALPPPYDLLYSGTDAILAEFAVLATRHPERVTWQPPVERGVQFSLGVATFGAPPPGAPRKPNVLIVFGEHARELITSDTALWLGRVLAGEGAELEAWPEAAAAAAATAAKGALPLLRRGLSLDAWAAELLQSVSITLVPVEVPDARRSVEEGQLCRRKSLAEVDLNRNWGVAWRSGAPRGGEEHGGDTPFSEPQSRALRDLATADPPVAYVNVHSGEWALYVPWDHKKALAQGMPADTEELIETLNTHCQCTRGAGGAASNYLAFGTSMDWMWQELGVPYSLTFELFGSNNEGRRADTWRLPPTAVEELSPGDDAATIAAAAAGRRLQSAGVGCLAMFNPDTVASYRTVVAGWVHNFLLLGEHIAAHAAHNATVPAVKATGGAAWLRGFGSRMGAEGGARPAPQLPRKALRPDASAAAAADADGSEDTALAVGGGGGFASTASTDSATDARAAAATAESGWLGSGWKRPAAALLMLAALLVLGERRRRGGALSAAARMRGSPATTRVRDL